MKLCLSLILLPYQQIPLFILFFFGQVDESVVIYEHINTEATGWNAQDYFTFTVSSPPAVLGSQMFHINITYDLQDKNSQLLANTGKISVPFLNGPSFSKSFKVSIHKVLILEREKYFRYWYATFQSQRRTTKAVYSRKKYKIINKKNNQPVK